MKTSTPPCASAKKTRGQEEIKRDEKCPSNRLTGYLRNCVTCDITCYDHCRVSVTSCSFFLSANTICESMSEDWDSKLVIGYKRDVAKVAKTDSDVNGSSHSLVYAPFFDLCWQL